MATSSELVLLDTNILVYAMNKDAPQHAACRALLDQAYAGTLNACLTAQVLFEYFAVVTSAQELTVPLAPTEALQDLERLMATFPLLSVPYDIAGYVMGIMQRTGLSGRDIFDVQLAAIMLANEVRKLYTYDEKFSKLPGIVTLKP